MDREFLDLYNRELQILGEHATDFAAEYPGIAERLGGIVGNRADPMVTGLLEGSAFLAARVQLKLKHEFSEFTSNLLEMLLPNYLAPTPSAFLAKFTPPFADPALRDGRRIARGVLIDATYRESSRHVACRFSLAAGVTLWPFELTDAQYLMGSGPLQALGIMASETAAALKLTLVLRSTEDSQNEPADAIAAKEPNLWASACRVTDLPIHLLGSTADAAMLAEQIFAAGTQAYLRHIDANEIVTVQPLPAASLQPIGFADDESLLPRDGRLFRGFELLRDCFILPRKFLGFRLTGLKPMVAAVHARSLELIFVFADKRPTLAATIGQQSFALYTAPAVNLFPKNADRIQLSPDQHEYHVVADRTRWMDFEPHRLLEVFAHTPGQTEKTPVRPLYAVTNGARQSATLSYTIRRLPRRKTVRERETSSPADYVGTDMFLTVCGKGAPQAGASGMELGIKALCSNRHLPEHLPVGEGGAEFRLVDDGTLAITCVDGPTPPRKPIYASIASRGELESTGSVAWRLINMLCLNHQGLVTGGAGRNAGALRDVLSLLVDRSDAACDRQIAGIRSVDSRPVVRKLRQRNGVGVARGTEVTVTVEDSAFEGSGAFLLGSVLDHFFAEYAGVNHFSQLVLRSVERGEIKRWAPRIGRRSPL